MKNFILGFVAALILAAIIYAAYPIIRGFFGGGGPVAPSELMPGAKVFGNLKVQITGAGKPVPNLEVDLGQPGGRMSFAMTDTNGKAFFLNVPVGAYNIFFNDLNYPKELTRISSVIPVEIVKDETTEKNIELKLKQ